MTNAVQTSRKSYPIDQSPFFRLQSRRELAELLDLSLTELEALANAGAENYSMFPKEVKGKWRNIEHPKPLLRKVQRQLTKYLGRIKHPAYLHSAYRGVSYVSNAEQHKDKFVHPSAKIDIKKFFPSAQSARVSRAFREQFGCSPDVAAVLGKLTTVLGHIPTGGNSSTMISFWAYKPMFDEINCLASENGVVMTCCVDDMTFTGPTATAGFLNQVRLIIRRFGLKTHKRHIFPANTPRIITGVAITSNGLKLPNNRRLLLHKAFATAEQEQDVRQKIKTARKLLGRATEAEQLEPKFRWEVRLATKVLNDALLAQSTKANQFAQGLTG